MLKLSLESKNPTNEGGCDCHVGSTTMLIDRCCDDTLKRFHPSYQVFEVSS